MSGLTVRESALAAGCPEKTASQAGSRLEKHPNVLAHLARLKKLESENVPGAGRDTDEMSLSVEDEFFEDPKEMLKHAMNDRRLDMKARMQAAIALLPFEHKKLGESGKKEDQQQAAHGVASGRFAPAAPPRSTAQMRLIK